MLVTPNGANAYVTNGSLGSVSQYTINPADGTLSTMSPPTVPTGADNYDVTVSPDGKSAYVTNAIDNTVSQYNIDSLTGTLTPKVPATVPTGSGPQGIVVTPNGANAYIADGGSGPGNTFTVSQYSIDPATGDAFTHDPHDGGRWAKSGTYRCDPGWQKRLRY